MLLVKSEGCVAGVSPEISFTPDTSSSLKPKSTEHTQGHSHSWTDSKTTPKKLLMEAGTGVGLLVLATACKFLSL